MDTRSLTINLPKGPIVANIENNELLVAQGIRYANGKRFCPPTEVESWSQPVYCTKPGPICPQVSRPFEPLGEMIAVDRPQSEDCLRVNVVAPVSVLKPEAKKLPVMVWIHGGAYVIGCGDLSLFDTRGLARRDMVIVSVGYRLGMLGYSRIPGVAPANLGLMDQIAALKWVQQNVEVFGGDPAQVTVFGQSAGGDATYSLLLAHGTESLYKQAIIISAPFGTFAGKSTKNSTLEHLVEKEIGKRDVATIPIDELMKIQYNVLETQKKAGAGSPGFILDAGEAPLPPASAYPARLREVARQKRVMVGYTRDDALPFVLMNPRATRFLSIPIIGALILGFIGRIATYFIFGKGAQAFHQQYVADGGQSSLFRIEYYPIGSKFRAAHCMETPFLFGGYEEWSKTPLLQGISRETYESLSREVKNLFESFVKHEPVSTENVIVKEGYTFQRGGSKL